MLHQIDTVNTINISKENCNRTIYMYILLIASFFLSNFYRISTSVVLPDLAIQWGISATAVGVISGIFFYAYAVAQPFCGLLNDIIGPVKVAFLGMVLTAIGTILMSIAPSAVLFSIGRLFTGLGLAPMLSGALVFQSNCFPIAKYATFAGITYTVGNFGTVLSVAPLNWLVNKFSFRSVFLGLAVICSLIAILLLCNIAFYKQHYIVKQKPRDGSFVSQLITTFRYVFHSRQLKTMLLVWMIICGTLICFQGLWAVQWYKVAFNVTLTGASFWATLIGIGVAFGNFTGGQIGRLIKSRRVIIISFSLAFTALWILEWILLTYHWSLAGVGIVGLLLGICGGIEYTQLTTGVNDSASEGSGGVLFGVMNAFVFVSVAFFQFLLGFLVDAFSGRQGGSPEGFSRAFAIIITILVLSQISLPLLKNIKRKE